MEKYLKIILIENESLSALENNAIFSVDSDFIRNTHDFDFLL